MIIEQPTNTVRIVKLRAESTGEVLGKYQIITKNSQERTRKSNGKELRKNPGICQKFTDKVYGESMRKVRKKFSYIPKPGELWESTKIYWKVNSKVALKNGKSNRKLLGKF